MQPSSSSLKFLLCLVLCTFFFSQNSWAGRVVKKKGKKVYIMLSADEASDFKKGDRLYLTTKSGKKRALVIIRKKRGKKVIAQLKKGKAKKGYLTKFKSAGKKKAPLEDNVGYEDAEQVAQEEEIESSRPELLFGLMTGYGIANQKVTENAGSFDTSGSSIAVKGLLDYSLFEDLGVRARLGIEKFSVSGANPSNQDVTTDITYLSIDMLLRYFIVNSDSFGFFLNAGMGIYSPMSKESGALDPASISPTSLLMFGAGVSSPLGGMDLFLGGDYNYYPPSETVETNVITAKLGLLFEL